MSVASEIINIKLNSTVNVQRLLKSVFTPFSIIFVVIPDPYPSCGCQAKQKTDVKRTCKYTVIQASAIQIADSYIQWLKSIATGACYQPDSDLSVGWSYPLFEQLKAQ